MSLGKVSIGVEANMAGFESDMGRAARIMERDLRRAARESEKNLQRVTQAATRVGVVIGTMAAGAAIALAALTREAINNADAMGKQAQSAGVAVDEWSKLTYAAGLSGDVQQQLQTSLSLTAKLTAEAAEETGKGAEVFTRLGIAATDASGRLRSSDQVFRDIATRFKELPDGATKTALAVELFGQRIGPQLIPLLNAGRDGLEEMGDELERMGGVVTPEAARMAAEFNDNLTRLKTQITSLGTGIAQDLLPDLVRLTDELAKMNADGSLARGVAGGIRSIANAIDEMITGFRIAYDWGDRFIGRMQQVQAVLPLGTMAGPGERIRMFQEGAERAAQPSRADELGAGLRMRQMGAVSYRDMNPDDREAARAENMRRLQQRREEADALKAQEEAERLLAKTEEERRQAAAAAREREAASKRAQAAADREAARAQQEAAREAKRIQDDAMAASGELDAMLRQQADTMGGPLVQAANQYADQLLAISLMQERLTMAGQMDEAQMERLNKAREQASALHEERIELIKAEKTEAERVLEDLQFELELMGLSNIEREKAIALRWANVDAASAEGQAISKALEALDAEREKIEVMDAFRGAAGGFLKDLRDETVSTGEAFSRMADRIIEELVRIAIQKSITNLFGETGTSGTGSAGGWMAAFASAFAGGREFGGRVEPGSAYIVGEKRPEVFVPDTPGTIVPSLQQYGGGGSMTMISNYNFAEPSSSKSRAQVEATRARDQTMAQARVSA